MSATLQEILKHKVINSWNLFWLISGPISLAMIIAMSQTDLTSGAGVSSMIQVSVRCAVPLLFIAFAASSVQVLFPGTFGGWLLRNRKFIGLAFAAAMGWQGFFILWLVTVYSDYYINEVYVLRDAIEGVVGYAFLLAMVVTSFKFGRQRLTPKQWKLLHKSGIYFLWAYAFSVYWWQLFYYPTQVPLDYIYYWAGFAAWALRAAAWSKKRRQRPAQQAAEQGGLPAVGMLGVAVVGVGLLAASFGSAWRQAADDILTGYSFTQIPELYLPYWPFQPYLPLFVIALGAMLVAKAKA
jgi:DMSO/TMAO reductase YedYZ heme-binding membrane subunit